MTKLIYVERLARDLKLGNLYCHWAVMEDGLYPEGRRILNISKSVNGRGKITITLDDVEVKLNPEHIVVVQEIA